MTVAELIDLLRKEDPEAIVVFDNHCDYLRAHICNVEATVDKHDNKVVELSD